MDTNCQSLKLHTKRDWKIINNHLQSIHPNLSVNAEFCDVNNCDINTLDIKGIENEDSIKKSSYFNIGQYVPFLNKHPLSATHVVKCDLERIETTVHNFVGGLLPCHDQGDRKYLKTVNQCWNDAYKFSDRHKNFIRNFNLRYECLDAQGDDFKAELWKKESEARKKNPQSAYNLNNEFDNDDYDFVKHILDDNNEDFEMSGPAYENELNNKREADNIMRFSGWLDKSFSVQNRACHE